MDKKLSFNQVNEYINNALLPVLKSIQVSLSVGNKTFKESDVNFKKNILSYFNDKSDYNEKDFNEKTYYTLKDGSLFIDESENHSNKQIKKSNSETPNIFNAMTFRVEKSTFLDKENEKTICVLDVIFDGETNSFILICDYGDEKAMDDYIDKILNIKSSITLQFIDNSKVYIDIEKGDVSISESGGGYASKLESYLKKMDNSKVSVFVNLIISNILEHGIKDDKLTLDLDIKPKAHAVVEGTNAEIWIDIDDYKDGFEVIKEIRRELALSPKDSFKIDSWEGFGKTLYKEKMNENDFDTIIEYRELIQDSLFPKYVIEEMIEYLDSDKIDEVISYMNESYNGESNYKFKSEVQQKKIENLKKDLSKAISELDDLESEISKSDKNHAEVVADLMIDKRDEIKEIKKNIISEKYKLEKINREPIIVEPNLIKIDDGKTVFTFDIKDKEGRVLQIGNPIKRYNYFIVDLDSKKIISGSINKPKADAKTKKISAIYPKLRLGVYNKSYAKNKLNLDTDSTKDMINPTKKSFGGIVIGSLAILTGGLALYYGTKSFKKKVHTKRGWKLDRKKRSKQKHELAYQKKKQSEAERISEIVKAKPFIHPLDLLFTDDLLRMVTGGIIKK